MSQLGQDFPAVPPTLFRQIGMPEPVEERELGFPASASEPNVTVEPSEADSIPVAPETALEAESAAAAVEIAVANLEANT